MAKKVSSRSPIINCHTHIFTGEHVPPYLAKKFVWWPFYYLLSLPLILGIVKFIQKGLDAIRFSDPYRAGKNLWYKMISWVRKFWLLNTLRWIGVALVIIHGLYIIYDWICLLITPDDSIANNWILKVRAALEEWNILFPINSLFLKGLLVAFVLLFIKIGRNLILFLLKRIWGFFQLLPGKMTTSLIERYILLCRFTLYKQQGGILTKLKAQYPPGTGFVVLPMDMEYMKAGKLNPKGNYHKQMEELAVLKNNNKDILYPFVFVDPRRIQADSKYFRYTFKSGRVDLDECFIKKYIEEYQFSGFKIYPALGYYPFEEELLPLWKYAAGRGIPITTHCIRGTIFYRGKKKPEWDAHPVFEELKSKGTYGPLLLPEQKNEDFACNFIHPLNYLCLLDEQMLRKLVGQAKDDRIRELFGYNGENEPLDHNLSQLKICFAHFGGGDQWKRYLESDRYDYSLQLIRNPEKGISFQKKQDDESSPAKLEQIWKYVDWYSIICSIMLQYPNVYSDISYILHDPDVFPLLKQTLKADNKALRKRVLYGTDFYVVRNHKSDKQIVADTLAGLDEEEFNLIARENPRTFLRLDQ